jgi:hypothetical protein
MDCALVAPGVGGAEGIAMFVRQDTQPYARPQWSRSQE